MELFSWFKTKFFGVDPESVAAYQTVLPHKIQVSVKRDGSDYIAKIDALGDKKVKGLLITEAKDFDTLVARVNDLVYTKVKMPLNIRPYYGNVFKPENYKQNSKKLVLTKA